MSCGGQLRQRCQRLLRILKAVERADDKNTQET